VRFNFVVSQGVYLLVGGVCSSDSNKRRTRYVQGTTEPEWHQTLVFMNLTRQQLASQTLELTVCDYDRFKTQPQDFLGQLSLNMAGRRRSGLYFQQRCRGDWISVPIPTAYPQKNLWESSRNLHTNCTPKFSTLCLFVRCIFK